jgi:putative aldouronate transport system permease protein
MKMAFVLVAAVTFALLLNEVRFLRIQRSIQTMVYLPHFLSWVILAGILRTILARDGMMNDFLGCFRRRPGLFSRPAQHLSLGDRL